MGTEEVEMMKPETLAKMSEDALARAIARLKREGGDDAAEDIAALKAEQERRRRQRWREDSTELFGDEEYDL
jgi:hypothetical protein